MAIVRNATDDVGAVLSFPTRVANAQPVLAMPVVGTTVFARHGGAAIVAHETRGAITSIAKTPSIATAGDLTSAVAAGVVDHARAFHGSAAVLALKTNVALAFSIVAKTIFGTFTFAFTPTATGFAPIARGTVTRPFQTHAVAATKFSFRVSGASVGRAAIHKIFVPRTAVTSSVLAHAIPTACFVFKRGAIHSSGAIFTRPSWVAVTFGGGFLTYPMTSAPILAQSLGRPRTIFPVPSWTAFALALDAFALLFSIAIVWARTLFVARFSFKSFVAVAQPTVARAMKPTFFSFVHRALNGVLARVPFKTFFALAHGIDAGPMVGAIVHAGNAAFARFAVPSLSALATGWFFARVALCRDADTIGR